MSGLRFSVSPRRRIAVVLAALSVLTTGIVASAPLEAAADGGVVKIGSEVVGSDGKTYSVTNHLTEQAFAPTPGNRPRKWLLTWAGDAEPGTGGSPDPDFLAVVDATPGTPGYGRVVNTLTLDSAFGNEPHHMQYMWHKGDRVYAGGLLSDTTYVFDIARLPQVRLAGITLPADTPCGSAPDAYTVLKDGTAYATYMGGPDVTGPCRYTDGQVRNGNGYAGSPGEVVRLDRSGKVLAEAPAATSTSEDPELCVNIPVLPEATCANPHGIAVREDLDRLITSDFAEVRNMVTPPAPPPANVGRKTVRIFDIADRGRPRLLSVSRLPDGPRQETNPIAEEPHMVMETAVTNQPHHRGAFASTMSGGAVFYTPDITDPNPKWREVFDDSTAFKALFPTDTPQAGTDGGSWLMPSPDDRYLFHVVLSGGLSSPAANKEAGMVYVLDIQPLLAAGRGTRCSIDDMREVFAGGRERDCPRLVSALPIKDLTSGGPHWAAMDTFGLGRQGYRETQQVSRLAVSNYFVSSTYVDGDHRVCLVDVGPHGELSLDQTFRDENQGTPCVGFDRTRWPHGDHGGARPHGVLFAVADADIR